MNAERMVRGSFNDETITVYQAYSAKIADAALAAGTFVAPFKRGRMTWIKPSFCWMMYRSGWASKASQERVLAITMGRSGFEQALANACLSSFEPGTYSSVEEWRSARKSSPVRVQWDPDRSVALEPLSRRAIQIGLSGRIVDEYVDHWITSITDVTHLAFEIHALVRARMLEEAQRLVPAESIYPLPDDIRLRIGADPPPPHSGNLGSGRPAVLHPHH